jgi:hypothetical protein
MSRCSVYILLMLCSSLTPVIREDGLIPPVLKHGPRSLPNGRTLGCQTQRGEMKVATRDLRTLVCGTQRGTVLIVCERDLK